MTVMTGRMILLLMCGCVCLSAQAPVPRIAVRVDPESHGVVRGTVRIVATITSSGSQISRVQFLLNGYPLGAIDASAPYEYEWDTKTAREDVAHVVGAVAQDSDGWTAALPIGVIVRNEVVQ